MKGLINKDLCNKLIKFYEDKQHMTTPEESYKFKEDKKMEDNFGCLNISVLKDNEGFQEPYEIILKYLEFYENTFVLNYVSFKNIFMTKTDNIRILKYDVGQCIKDHTDVGGNIRGSLTINLNDDYEGGEFRFFDGQEKLNLLGRQ